MESYCWKKTFRLGTIKLQVMGELLHLQIMLQTFSIKTVVFQYCNVGLFEKGNVLMGQPATHENIISLKHLRPLKNVESLPFLQLFSYSRILSDSLSPPFFFNPVPLDELFSFFLKKYLLTSYLNQ